jgi:hypothetical protein
MVETHKSFLWSDLYLQRIRRDEFLWGASSVLAQTHIAGKRLVVIPALSVRLREYA